MPALCSRTVAALVVSLLAVASASWARRVRVDCVDGIPNPLVEAYRERRYCDADRACDGVCTFAFCTLEDFLCSVNPACVGPGNGVCAPGQAPADAVVMRAGRRQVLFAGTVHAVGPKVVLRCRSTPRDLSCP